MSDHDGSNQITIKNQKSNFNSCWKRLQSTKGLGLKRSKSLTTWAADRRLFPHVYPHQCFSHRVEFGDNEHADGLIEARAHAQALLVGAPVQAGNWLSGQRDVLQQADTASHAHVGTICVLLAALSWVLAGNHATM